MSNPQIATVTLAAANAAIVAASQTPGAAGNLTLVGGGTVTLDTARRVLFTFAGADAARSFVVYGTTAAGTPIQETVAGASSSTSTTLMDFKTVTRISVDAATAGSLTVGTSAIGSTRWIKVDMHRASFAVGLVGVVASASPVTWIAEYTLDPIDPAIYEAQPGNVPGSFKPPIPIAMTAPASGSANAGALHLIPCMAVRFTVTAGTTLFTGTVIQTGLTN